MKSVILLTDFGVDDHYVGVLHSVLQRAAPGVPRVDLVHSVPAGDIWTAAYFLRSSELYLPEDAVILAVVDPGVGTDRRAVAASIGKRWIVAPDNGLATALGDPTAVWELDPQQMDVATLSATFHGRDLFAPAAARLARGEDAATLGAALDPHELHDCPLPLAHVSERGIDGVIQHVDRFGNAVTNIAADQLPSGSLVRTGWHRICQEVHTYGEAPASTAVYLQGSSGYLELAMRGQSVASVLNIRLGDDVEVVFPTDGTDASPE